MFEEEEEWLQAIMALTCRYVADEKLRRFIQERKEPPKGFAECHIVQDPDHKPLANLFRSGKPIPEGARDMLAELHDPSDGNPLGVRLEVIETSTIKKSLRLFSDVLRTSNDYHIEVKKGKSSEEAAARRILLLISPSA